ncbi:MAG: type II toxin-antitoxin system PemK/MazF family toxin [Acidimicrobiales bacterium]
MRRAEIWTASAGSGYVGKRRPVVVLQDDRFDALGSVTVCAFTTDPTEAPLIRLVVEPDDTNGLRGRCSLMVDKITTMPVSKLGDRIGRLGDDDMVRLNRAMLVFLGLAG